MCLRAGQAVFEGMFEDINNLLNSYDVPALYGPEDMELINAACRRDCLAKRIPATKINIFAQFVARLRHHIHVVVCMSPFGEAFRNRLRMFPALVNCTTIDWFSEWPVEALHSVAEHYVNDPALELGHNMQPVISVRPSLLHASCDFCCGSCQAFLASTPYRVHASLRAE